MSSSAVPISQPCEANLYLAPHVQLICQSFQQVVGRAFPKISI
ncbi:MAG: hypothetical protein AAGD25_28105 [Cyanobacteria bacterium P01_F01_bin.150]